jgi:microcystin-dependent protein
MTEVMPFAGAELPSGWMPCDGRLLAIDEHHALFELIGTHFGGDGHSNFALPDLQCRIALGYGEVRGLTILNLGDKGGEEKAQLSPRQMAALNHHLVASASPARQSSPIGAMPAAPEGVGKFYLRPGAPGAADAQLPATTLAYNGQGQPHPNMMPGLGIQYIICVEGERPVPNIGDGEG